MIDKIIKELEQKERDVEFMDEYSDGFNSCLHECISMLQKYRVQCDVKGDTE